MAGDWVKVRVWLHKDPKVVSMADYLAGEREFMNWLTNPVQRACEESAYEHVTRNVTCHVTRSLLVTVWGVARERGYRSNDDLILPHCDIDVLDEIAEIPRAGAAMEFVGWAIGFERDDGVWCVRFPNYFEEEASPAERHAIKNADRQRRLRERRRKETSHTTTEGNTGNRVTERNVTVTPREEKSREEEKNPPNPPAGGERPRRKRTANEDMPPDFVMFWSAYPRKVAKPAALRSWRRLDPVADVVAAILAALERHKATEQWQRDGGQFIPHPATWLNQRRWEDTTEPTVNGHAPKPRVFADQTRHIEDSREVVPRSEVNKIIQAALKDGNIE